jgi:L-2-hydroxyglutarate oxidase LhgO
MVAKQREARQHGDKGVYCGGDWVDIEDCGENFNISEGTSDKTCSNFSTTSSKCATCPRSRSKYVQSHSDGTYDVIIIGAGCIGSAIARELSKKDLSILLLESADDVTQGATKGNSGIVHAGFDDTPGTNRAKFCWPGNQMFEQLDRELHFGYQKNGSLVIAKNDDELLHLKELKKRGEKNGVKRLKIIKKKELFEIEPYVSEDSVGALYSPDAGNLIPYEFAIALAENAVDNGVELRIRRQVTDIKVQSEDELGDGLMEVICDHWEPEAYANIMPEHEKIISTKQDEVDLAESEGIKNISGSGSGKNTLGQAIMKASACMIFSLLGVHNTAPKLAIIWKKPVEEMILYGGICSLLMAVILAYTLYGSGGHYSISISGSSSGNDNNGDNRKSIGSGGNKVTVEEMKVGGSGSKTAMNGVTVGIEKYKTRYIVNAAGAYSDKIAQMLGDNSFKIKPRLGDYLLLNRNQGHLASHTLFPCPGPLGKGVLVQTTLWGNLILGPTARDTHDPTMMSQSIEDIQRYILSKCKSLIPSFDPKEVIHAFCGARAKSDRGDWIIEQCPTNMKCIHAAGIDSPGLAGSPAIALEVVKLLEDSGLRMKPNKHFNPLRAPIIRPKNGWKGLKPSANRSRSSTNPKENVVCKCEKVTEEEVVTALHRSLPIDSTQAIRKRTRAGMGHCQASGADGQYNCECRISDIIYRENNGNGNGNVEANVGRRPWPATSSLSQRWIDDKDKDTFAELMENTEGK